MKDEVGELGYLLGYNECKARVHDGEAICTFKDGDDDEYLVESKHSSVRIKRFEGPCNEEEEVLMCFDDIDKLILTLMFLQEFRKERERSV